MPIHRGERDDGNISLTFEFSKLPAPQRRYLADCAAVSMRDGMVHIMFGQRAVDGVKTRSILVLAMFPQGLGDFIRSCEPMRQGLSDYFSAGGRRVELTSFTEDAPQTVTLSANIIVVAQVGDEACLDCFNVSPFANRAGVAGAGKIPIDPVVRIDLHTSLFAAILDKLRTAPIGGSP